MKYASSYHFRISPGMRPVNEKRRYIVTTYFIGWAHTQTGLYHLMRMGRPV